MDHLTPGLSLSSQPPTKLLSLHDHKQPQYQQSTCYSVILYIYIYLINPSLSLYLNTLVFLTSQLLLSSKMLPTMPNCLQIKFRVIICCSLANKMSSIIWCNPSVPISNTPASISAWPNKSLYVCQAGGSVLTVLVTSSPTKDVQMSFHGKQQAQMKKSKRNTNSKEKSGSVSKENET